MHLVYFYDPVDVSKSTFTPGMLHQTIAPFRDFVGKSALFIHDWKLPWTPFQIKQVNFSPLKNVSFFSLEIDSLQTFQKM